MHAMVHTQEVFNFSSKVFSQIDRADENVIKSFKGLMGDGSFFFCLSGPL